MFVASKVYVTCLFSGPVSDLYSNVLIVSAPICFNLEIRYSRTSARSSGCATEWCLCDMASMSFTIRFAENSADVASSTCGRLPRLKASSPASIKVAEKIKILILFIIGLLVYFATNVVKNEQNIKFGMFFLT